MTDEDKKELQLLKTQAIIELKKMEQTNTAKEVASKYIGKSAVPWIVLLVIVGVVSSAFLPSESLPAVIGLVSTAVMALITMLASITGTKEKEEKPVKEMTPVVEAEGIPTDEIGKFFIVEKPDQNSEMEDVVYEMTLPEFALQIKGGLEIKNILGVYKQKSDARRAGTEALKAFQDTNCDVILHNYFLDNSKFEKIDNINLRVNSLVQAYWAAIIHKEDKYNYVEHIHHSQVSIKKHIFDIIKFPEGIEFNRREDSVFCYMIFALPNILNVYIKNELSIYLPSNTPF
jgi:hypothetical protein